MNSISKFKFIMGICCSAKQIVSDEIYSAIDKNENYEEGFFDCSQGNEVLLESKIYDNTVLSKEINECVCDLNRISDVKKISLVELWNISIMHKDNYANSMFFVYDLRETKDKNENFIKKMKQINYSYDELKIMSDDKINKFKKFIYNKCIKIYFPDDDFKEYTQLLNFIIELKTKSLLCLLNSTLEKNVLSPYSQLLLEFIEEKYYDCLLYVLLSYSHLTYLKKEGYVFISFPHEHLSEMQSELKSSFNQKFNVFSSIIISNKELRSTDKVQYISDSIDTVIQSKSSIEEICLLMRSETEKGHSIEFSISQSSLLRDDWVIILILLLWKIMLVISPNAIINYLSYKCMFIPRIRRRLHKEKTNRLFKQFGLGSDVLS